MSFAVQVAYARLAQDPKYLREAAKRATGR
jgi:hypothetical protein